MKLEDLHPREPKSPPEFFGGARRRLGMWIPVARFPDACALVTGFFEGRGGWPMHASFSTWIVERYGGELKVVWWCHILQIALPARALSEIDTLPPDEDATAIDKLFELLLAWAEETDMGLRSSTTVWPAT